jgi:hypothetical protein
MAWVVVWEKALHVGLSAVIVKQNFMGGFVMWNCKVIHGTSGLQGQTCNTAIGWSSHAIQQLAGLDIVTCSFRGMHAKRAQSSSSCLFSRYSNV